LYPNHLRKDMVEDFNDLKNECIKGVKDWRVFVTCVRFMIMQSMEYMVWNRT